MFTSTNRVFAAIVLSLQIEFVTNGSAEEMRPLADLPSKPGGHVARIQKLGDDSWLDLGAPAADPKWGMARGRSWTAKMAFAPELHVAFLYGEGVHGWWNEDTGRYMDDLWAYDVNAHRWISVHPGADVKHLDLKLNEDGVEVTHSGEPVPVAQMAHGYEGTTYDIDLRRFMFMPCSGGYWENAFANRRMAWLGEKRNEVGKNCSPWLYDTQTGKWDRRATEENSPSGGFGDVLMYVPSVKRTFLRDGTFSVWWYDGSKNTWSKARPEGPPPPFGIDPTACYDPKRDRIYLGGGSYPVAEGPNALWIYDIKSESWIDPKPQTRPCKGSNSYATNIATMTFDTTNDIVVLNLHHGEGGGNGIYIYDPETNEWTVEPRPLPKSWQRCVNAFYDPELNVHVYHHAGDSDDNGKIWAYRHKTPTS